MRKLLTVMLLTAAIAVPSAAVANLEKGFDSNSFQATITGSEEFPPVVSAATGEAKFVFSEDGPSMRYSLEVEDIQGAFVAHIHLGARGKNGPIVVFLFGPVSAPGVSEIDVEGTVTAKDLVGPLKGHPLSDLLENLRSGNAYANVHTFTHPGGEIRGQITTGED